MNRVLLSFVIISTLILGSGCNQSPDKETSKNIFTSQRLIKYLENGGTARFLFSSGRLKITMEKLYESAINGKLKAYKSDKLNDLMTLDDVKKAGGVTTVLDIQDPENPDRTSQKDTFVNFIYKDMSAIFSVDQFNPKAGTSSGEVKVIAIALAAKRNIPGIQEGFYSPIFYLKLEDLQSVLGNEESTFLDQFLFKTLSVSESQTNLEM